MSHNVDVGHRLGLQPMSHERLGLEQLGDHDERGLQHRLQDIENFINQMGVWKDFTPAWDTTLGVSSENGTWNEARLTRIGNTVHFYAMYTVGTTFSTGGTGQERWEFTDAPGLSPYTTRPFIAWTRFRDVGTDNYYAPGIITGTSTAYYNVYAFGATSGTNANINSFSSSIPFTVTNGDEFYFQGWFEADRIT